MLRARAHVSFCAAVALLAPLSHADENGYTVAYGKDVYYAGEDVEVYVYGEPGTLGYLLFDMAPGPVDVPGIGTFGVGLSSSLVILELPPVPDTGVIYMTCSFDCDAGLVGKPVYTQGVAIDFDNLELCLSNVAELFVDGSACEGEGCTPGYWKNHLDSWVGLDYQPGDDFDTTFGVDLFDTDQTLLEALEPDDNPQAIQTFPSHAVAALLNANSSVEFGLTEAEIIAIVQDVFNGGEFGMEEAKNILNIANEAGCPLN